ncbi:phosphoribosylamine--glycine ligase, partial [bacterium]|nr:phosphoribosylamine--glycine ligase [bacterium]
GNAGISEYAELVPIVAENIEELRKFAKKNNIDLTIVGGPEISLTKGIVDEFNKHDLAIMGPSKTASKLEASKIYARKFMKKYNIPTAAFECFDDIDDAKDYIDSRQAPYAIKTDGITNGKGFIIAKDNATAKIAVHVMMKDRTFGSAGSKVIIEELLEGIDASILAFTDGKTIKQMVSAKQFISAYDGNKGPNTGGLGAISPAPPVDDKVKDQIYNDIMMPVLNGLKEEKINYKGVLYIHLVCTKSGPKVVDFNLRFGDPQAQVVLPRLDSDLGEIFKAIKEGTLEDVDIKWNSSSVNCVTLVSSGYPMKYEIGKEITGIKKMGESDKGLLFHAGTKQVNGKTVSSGGRVLNVIGIGENYEDSRINAYELCKDIHFDGMHFRRDIGPKAADTELSY